MDFEKKVFRVDQMTAQPNGGVNGVISLVDAAGDPWTPGGDTSVAWGDVTGKPSTFPPTIGTTATTAMAGNTPIPPAATWANLSGKPAVIGAGADAASARTAIGAGTGNSNLAIGTTASTAAAGNHTHAFSALAGTVSDATGANLQAILEDLAGRIADLEEPAG